MRPPPETGFDRLLTEANRAAAAMTSEVASSQKTAGQAPTHRREAPTGRLPRRCWGRGRRHPRAPQRRAPKNSASDVTRAGCAPRPACTIRRTGPRETAGSRAARPPLSHGATVVSAGCRPSSSPRRSRSRPWCACRTSTTSPVVRTMSSWTGVGRILDGHWRDATCPIGSRCHPPLFLKRHQDPAGFDPDRVDAERFGPDVLHERAGVPEKRAESRRWRLDRRTASRTGPCR